MSQSPGGKENGKKQRASPAQKERELNISSQHDELVITKILESCPEPEPVVVAPKTVPQHPRFGGKQPKQHTPPKCISVLCKEEKNELKGELEDIHKELDNTRRELEETKEELSECNLLIPVMQGTVVIYFVLGGTLPKKHICMLTRGYCKK